MQSAIDQFRISLQRVRDLISLHNSIVYRRNKIAHEADIDPTFGLGNRWPIDELMVGDAVNFIEQVVEGIHQIL
jgi:hypothetical protein